MGFGRHSEKKFIASVPCLEKVSAVNAVTSSPDDFCDFEINCGLRTDQEGTETVTNNNILY